MGDAGDETAQPLVREMFLAGERIAHSLSPAMWNHVFRTTATPITYGLRDVATTGLDAVLAEIRGSDVLAANVTMPHKTWAAASADTLGEDAAATGAANLLHLRGGVLHGENTDVAGARALLERRAPFASVTVLGAGGTAAAVVRALRGMAGAVVVVNRDPARAEQLVADVGDDTMRAAGWDGREREIERADLVVSTVPLVDDTPFDLRVLGPDAHVYDVVYRRRPTALQRAVSEMGRPLVDGLAHLAAQAIAMLEPLGFDAAWARLLVEGLTHATERPVTAWGDPLV